MRLRRLAETVSATTLGLALLLAPAAAQETASELGIPLPEQPALVIVKRDAEPQELDIPDRKSVV